MAKRQVSRAQLKLLTYTRSRLLMVIGSIFLIIGTVLLLLKSPWYGFVISFTIGIIFIGYAAELSVWTGFGRFTSDEKYEQFQREKTFWDWLQLLIIPTVLAGGAILFNMQQNQTSNTLSQQQHQVDMQIADNQQQDSALQTYLDKMSDLLTDKHLKDPRLGVDARSVARARTLTVLLNLKEERKGILLRFLYEAGLIKKGNVFVSLNSADFGQMKLEGANLSGADLSGADLSGADLSGADLSGADLSGADLSGADLSGAKLNSINLINATLSDATLSQCNFSNANLNEAIIIGAHLEFTTFIHATLSHTDLYRAHLHAANLSNANLTGANLSYSLLDYAVLEQAQLSDADMNHAILTQANLSNANMDSVDLNHADMSSANLKHAILNSADVSRATYTQQQLDQAFIDSRYPVIKK